MNFQVFKLVLEKVEEPGIKLPTSTESSKNQESSRKTSALLTMPKPLIVWITVNCGKFWKRWAYQTTWPASWETCMQVRKQQLELDREQQCFQIGKGVRQGCILSTWLLNIMLTQCTSWETLGWKKHKLESRLLGEISINLRYAGNTTLKAENEEELKSWWKWKRRVKKLA